MNDSVHSWKPGDVAVNVKHGYRGIFVRGNGHCGHHLGQDHWHNESGLADGPGDVRRPIAAIDPEDRQQVESLARAVIVEAAGCRIDEAILGVGLSEGLRAIAIANPKPEEPTGIGAVVEDSAGGLWIRTEPGAHDTTPWTASWTGRTDDPQPCEYGDIAAVRVLSEGVR